MTPRGLLWVGVRSERVGEGGGESSRLGVKDSSGPSTEVHGVVERNSSATSV